jgi:Uma2 family endonuclease
MTLLQRRLTLDEFLELPERKPALEFEEGVITQKVSPKGKHSRLQLAFCMMLNRVAEAARRALAFPELRASWNNRSYVPDVSLFRWDRIPRDESGEIANDFFEPPDIAIEIVSPKQSVTPLVRKCVWYVANGVRLALLVDPADRSILLFRPDVAPLALRSDDPIDLQDVLPGLVLTVQQVFDSLKLA